MPDRLDLFTDIERKPTDPSVFKQTAPDVSDNVSPEESSVSMEKLYYNIFYRDKVIRRKNQITQLQERSALTEIPFQGILHVVDDNFLMNKPLVLVPDVNDDTMRLAPIIKFMWHVLQPVYGVVPIPESFQLVNQGLNTTLTNFNRKYKRWIRPVPDLQRYKDLPDRMLCFNYNPLYRARIFGEQRYWRRFRYIFASIFNMMTKYPDKPHFLPLPVSNNVYEKPEFNMSFKGYNKMSIRHPEDAWYLFMMNLIGFIHTEPTESLLSSIPSTMWDKIHLIFYTRNKMLIHTLANLKEWSSSDGSLMLRFIAQLNALAMSGAQTSMIDYSERDVKTDTREITENEVAPAPKGVVDTDEEVNLPEGPEVRPPIATPYAAAIPLDPVTPNASPTIEPIKDLVEQNKIDWNPVSIPVLLENDRILDGLKIVPAESTPTYPEKPEFSEKQERPTTTTKAVDAADEYDTEQDPDEISPDEVQDIPEDMDDQPEEDHPEDPKKKKDPVVTTTASDDTVLPSDEDEELSAELASIWDDIDTIEEDRITVDNGKIGSTKYNAPAFTAPKTQDEEKEIAKEAVAEADAGIEAYIATHSDGLTDKQVDYLRRSSQAYKKIKIDGQTIEQIQNTVPEMKIDEAELDFLKDKVMDPSVLKSTTQNFDQQYMDTMFKRDLVNTLSYFNRRGMFLQDVNVEDISDWQSDQILITARYEDINHRTHTLRFTVPKVDKRGYCKIKGVLMVLKKQRCPNPICKVSPTRVTLQSDYNKYLVERNTNVANSFITYIDKVLAKTAANVQYVLGSTTYNTVMPYEYTAVARKYVQLEIIQPKSHQGWSFLFHRDLMNDWLEDRGVTDKKVVEHLSKMEKELKAILFGLYGTDLAAYMKLDGTVIVQHVKDDVVVNGNNEDFLDVLCQITEVGIVGFSEWVDLKLVKKAVPMAFALCYRYGLSYMLNYTKTRYYIFDKKTRIKRRWSDTVIKFADKTLVIPRVPLTNSLIFAGLDNYDLSKINMEDMDSKDVYFQLLQSKRISTYTLKSIDNFFDFFIDPITREVLAQMNEPTDIKDLLIRACALLSTEDHRPPASSTNFRFRSYERINAAIYKAMTKQLAVYQNKGIGATNKFSIPDFTISQMVCTDQMMENVDTINPINDIKYKSEYGHGGFGGRASTDTFMVEDRQFTDDNSGIMSEATIDSGKTGFAASMCASPTIANTRGMTIVKDKKDLTPSEVMSFTGILFPCMANDDGKRANFVSIHASHYVPTLENNLSRVQTGSEMIVAHRCNPPFAYCAEEDGTITKVDPKAGVLQIHYSKSNRTVAVNFGDEYDNNGGGGFYTTQNVVLNGFKQGDKVKRGDVITYNEKFFKPDPLSKQVTWCQGVNANVALIDCDYTLDDSSIISRSLANRLGFNPVHIRDIVLEGNTTIHEVVKIGDELSNTDSLMIFDQSAMDDDMYGNANKETREMLSRLNRNAPRAKFSGKIVKIEAFYKGDPTTFSKSVQALIAKASESFVNKAKAATGAENASAFPRNLRIASDMNRVGANDLTDTNVIFRFYIQQDMGMNGGDKCEFCSSLKSVLTGVQEEDWEVDDKSIKVQALFSAIGIGNRIILSPMIVGLGSRAMEQLEKDILKMYFG